MAAAIEHFWDFQGSWITESIALFLIPFIHEDVAIIGGSLLVIEHRLPLALALVCLYAGMAASDMALFGLGVLANRNVWVRARMRSHRSERIGHWLSDHTAAMVIVARLIPGLMFPVYVACGMSGVRFARFAVVTLLTGIIYLPVVFFLVSAFGAAVLSSIGYWSWLLVIVFLVAMATRWSQSPNWQLLLRVSRLGGAALLKRVGVDGTAIVTHRGMPRIGDLKQTVSLAERIPPILFYIPLAAQWFWLALNYRSLSLPALANPSIEVGGLWGESKSSYLAMVGDDQRRWLAAYTTLRRSAAAGSAQLDVDRALAAMADAGLGFPLVVKPDIGWRGYGVRLIVDAEELAKYIAAFPVGETIILQRPIDWDGEAGVLYARAPGTRDGHIVSLTLRYFPHVVGDGRSSVRDLILRDARAAWKAGAHLGLDEKHLGQSARELDIIPAAGETVRLSFIGSNRVGGFYRDAREHITPSLCRRFDAISKSMPDFYYGRYDVRFQSLDHLRNGEAFAIIEINGAGGESINVWDPSMPLRQVYRELFTQQRILFEIGAANRARGHRPPGAVAVLRSQLRQHRLIRRYPASS